MTSDSNQPAPPPVPRPSVFISYASEDRAPTRQLRETLAAAGLDVWYDEIELGGGDAWDQKIRRQIRECTYFMPVISMTTERRREGYFRREWRLATERSLDMADDVMFLVPVVIDDTQESTARVPEKFLTVQWLRLPGGQPSPALSALAQRLVAHDAAPAPMSRSLPPPSRPRPQSQPATPPPVDGPPPMPPFPPRPTDSDHKLKYYAETVWWGLTAAWLLFKRLPKVIRVLFSVWMMIAFISRCSRESHEVTDKARKHAVEIEKTGDAKSDPVEEKPDSAQALQKVAKELDATATKEDAGKLEAGIARVGAELVRAVSKEINSNPAAAPLIGVIPFDAGVSDPVENKFANQVFKNALGELALARTNQARPLPVADAAASDEQLRLLAAQAGDGYFVVAHVEEADVRALSVRLLATKTSAILWSGRFPIGTSDVATTASQIAQGVLSALPKS